MFRFLTAGESHGPCLTMIVEGLPAGLAVDSAIVDADLRRRQGGYVRGGRMKIERDTARFLSGVRHGKTLGSPIQPRQIRRFPPRDDERQGPDRRDRGDEGRRLGWTRHGPPEA